jgi:hypothetical protein
MRSGSHRFFWKLTVKAAAFIRADTADAEIHTNVDAPRVIAKYALSKTENDEKITGADLCTMAASTY